MKFVITGATGNTGRPLTETLLAAGHEVVAISRQAEHLEPLMAQGAIPAIGHLQDEAFLTQTFTGADAVYALIPPHFGAEDFRAYQNAVARALTQSLQAAGVSHVVTLSSFGAHRPDTGVVGGLYDLEQILKAGLPGANVLYLRAGFFYENFFGMIPAVQQAGVLGGFPLSGESPIYMVGTADIAAVAAQRLQALDFSGHGHQAVAHREAISLAEAASILGASIGKPELSYVRFPDEQFRAAMKQMGAGDSIVDRYLEFGQAADQGALAEGTDWQPGDGTPTDLKAFAATWAGAVQQAQQA